MICVPIKEKDPKVLLKSFEIAQKEADLTEIWFDELGANLNESLVAKIFSKKKKPIIFKSLGNKETLYEILQHPVDYLDLDYKTPRKLIQQLKSKFKETKLIISFHNFKSTPNLKSLIKTANSIDEKGADIIKIATFANNFEDCLKIFSLLEHLKEKDKTAICLAMGKEGKLTRLAGHLFGNYLMYCPLAKDKKTASGQLTVKELCHLKSVL